jgi:hypothetical protein
MDIASLHPSYPPIGDAFRVSQDYVHAYMWFNLSAEQGDQDATQSRDNVALKMTPARIAEAQKLAREWKPKP